MARKTVKKRKKAKKKKSPKTGMGGWPVEYLEAQANLNNEYGETKNFKDPSEWDHYYGTKSIKNNNKNINTSKYYQSDDFLETELYNAQKVDKEKKKEHNYLLIIGILIAACIGLYNGMVLDAWNIFWIIYVGIAIYGSIATFLKKW
tara:strand:+ start:120 stop:560 length:441 start_codon:yes stop_codon:yes gene_type:complete